MSVLVALLVQLFGELVLGLAAELAWALLLAGARRIGLFPGREPDSAAVFVFLALGGLTGLLSVLVGPADIFETAAGGLLGLALIPIAAGITMMLWGRMRARRGRPRSELGYFATGAALALGVAGARALVWLSGP